MSHAPHALGSRNVLRPHQAELFPDDTLKHRVARAICAANCLPRKEFYEAWEVARRVRRRHRGGRVWDLAAGHGVLAALLLILDDSSPEAVCVDRRRPPSQTKVLAALEARWPRLAGRVRFVEADLSSWGQAPAEVGDAPSEGDLVVSAHACGPLTDVVLQRATAAGARVAVLPCCHDKRRCEVPSFAPWLPVDVAIDIARVTRLEAQGYAVHTQQIPAAVTPKNRLIIAAPAHRTLS